MSVLSIIVFVALVAALIDIIIRDESQVRFLPKILWLLLVVLLPLIGTVLWFALGRSHERSARPKRTVRMPRRSSTSAPMPTASVTVHPVPSRDGRSTEQQLADLEREIEEDKRRAQLEQGRKAIEGE